jgi:hypothetical protein
MISTNDSDLHKLKIGIVDTFAKAMIEMTSFSLLRGSRIDLPWHQLHREMESTITHSSFGFQLCVQSLLQPKKLSSWAVLWNLKTQTIWDV